jgi:hypothetical protein
VNIPIIHYNEQRAGDAFAAYQAVRQREKIEPALADNPAWQEIAAQAYQQFEAEFVRLGSVR